MHELHPVGGMLWSTVVLGIMPFILVLTGAVVFARTRRRRLDQDGAPD